MSAISQDLERIQKFQRIIDRATAPKVRGWNEIPATDPLKIVAEIVAVVSSSLDQKIEQLPKEIAQQLPGIFGITDKKAEASRGVVEVELDPSVVEEFVLPNQTEIVSKVGEDEIVFRSEESVLLFPTQSPLVIHEKGEVLIGLSSIPDLATLNLFFELERGIKAKQINWFGFRKGAWIPLSVSDSTKNFSMSGIVKFFVSNVLTEKNVINGLEHYWIKLKVDSNESSLPLRSVKINVVPVSNLKSHQQLCVGSGTGLKNQSITLPMGELLRPFQLKVYNSERASYEYWTEVQSFFLSSTESKHWRYSLETNEIIFGDGLRGSCVPPGFDNIWVEDFNFCDGAKANLSRTSPIQLKSEDYRVQSITLCEDIHSGVSRNRQSNLLAQLQSKLVNRERAITIGDYRDVALAASGRIGEVYVRQSNRFDIEIFPILREDYARNKESLDFEPFPTDLSLVEDYLNDRRSLNVRLKVEAPVYRDITIHAQLFVRRTTQDIRNEIESILRSIFSPYGPDRENIFPGMRISRDSVVKVLEGCPLIISMKNIDLEDQESGLHHSSISLESNELARIHLNIHLMEGAL